MKSSALFLVDTNIVTFLVNRKSAATRERMKDAFKYANVAVSTLTEAEILFGLENRPEAIRLRSAVHLLFGSIQVLPWDSAAALAYSKLRVRVASLGKSLSAIDMLIAAHAIAAGATLVSHDRAFQQITPLLNVVDWATDL